MARREGARDLGGLGLGIFDDLGFVQNHHVVFLREQHLGIARQQRVGGEHDVVIGEPRERLVTRVAMQRERLEARREAFSLAPPVHHQAGGRHHERRFVEAAGFFFHQQVRQCLYGFAEAHVVGQYAAEFVFAQELQPVEAVVLIGAQFGLESSRRGHRANALEVAQAPAQLAQFFAAMPGELVAKRGIEAGELAGLRARQLQPPVRVERFVVVEFRERGQHRAHARDGHRQQPAVRQARERMEIVVECGEIGARQRRFAQPDEHQRQQVDAFAGERDAELDAEPVVRRAVVNLGVPVVAGLDDAVRIIVVDLHLPASRAQRRYPAKTKIG